MYLADGFIYLLIQIIPREKFWYLFQKLHRVHHCREIESIENPWIMRKERVDLDNWRTTTEEDHGIKSEGD